MFDLVSHVLNSQQPCWKQRQKKTNLLICKLKDHMQQDTMGQLLLLLLSVSNKMLKHSVDKVFC